MVVLLWITKSGFDRFFGCKETRKLPVNGVFGRGLAGGRLGLKWGFLGRNASNGLFMGISTIFGAVVLMAMACASLLADGADSNHLFESKGSLDAFFGDSPQSAAQAPGAPEGAVLVRGRFIRNVPEGMLVKCGKPVPNGTDGISRVYGLALLKGYPQRGALATGDPIRVIAHGDGTTYSFTNSAGVDRTVDVYDFEAFAAAPNPSAENPAPPAPIETGFPVEGSKPRGLPETRGEDHPHPPGSAPEKIPPSPERKAAGGEGAVKGNPSPDKAPSGGDAPRAGPIPMAPPKP